MEDFKLDLSKLTPVAERDRVRGNWYVVADTMRQFGQIRQWHSDGNIMYYINGEKGNSWHHWFAIPPGLPGFPKAELPDEFELRGNEWEYTNRLGKYISVPRNSTFRRIKPTLPELTIPSGTKQERIEFLKKELEKLETK